MAVRHRLLALNLPDPRLDAFRAALVLWVVTTTTLLGQQRLGARIAPQVRTKLEFVSAQGLAWGVDSDIEAWILSLGGMCAVADSVDELWFMDSLSNVFLERTATPELLSTEVILSHLKELQLRFFYHEAVYGPRAEHLARKIASTLSTPSTQASV